MRQANLTENLDPASITRSGDKYWLSPAGELFQTWEHNEGAKTLANAGKVNFADAGMPRFDGTDLVPPVFGCTQMFKAGWVRLQTTREAIWANSNTKVDGTNAAQKKTLRAMVDQFSVLNRQTPDLIWGEGGVSPCSARAIEVDVTAPRTVSAADHMDLDAVPSFYKQRGRSAFGDSVRRFMNLFN